MSMSRGCEIIERHPGEWYCMTATTEYDYDFVNYTVNGPYGSSDKAIEEIPGPNPGACSITPHEALSIRFAAMIDAALEAERKLIASARRATKW